MCKYDVGVGGMWCEYSVCGVGCVDRVGCR